MASAYLIVLVDLRAFRGRLPAGCSAAAGCRRSERPGRTDAKSAALKFDEAVVSLAAETERGQAQDVASWVSNAK